MPSFSIPDFLTHYYEKNSKPFSSLSMLPFDEAEQILDNIRSENNRFASQRQRTYLPIRRELEEQLRSLFIKKGGKPQLMYPHYFVLGNCSWVLEWYLEGQEIRLPLNSFCPSQISFTYGDSFPAMRYNDGKPYGKQVYTISELPQLVFDYGLPQEWNPVGEKGPERYIEAQVWSPISHDNFDIYQSLNERKRI